VESISLRFLKVIILLSPVEKLRQSLFYLSFLFSVFFSSTTFQMYLRSSLHFFLGSIFLIHKRIKLSYVINILCLLRVSTSHMVILREARYGGYITSLRQATRVAETCRRRNIFVTQDYHILLYAFVSVITLFTELIEWSRFTSNLIS